MRLLFYAAFSLLTLLVSSCAGSSLGDSLQQSLEADPQLEESPPFQSTSDQAEVNSSPSSVTEALPTESSSPASPLITAAPQPGDPSFIGPLPAPTSLSANRPGQSQSPGEPNLQAIPEDLRDYVEAVLELGVLPLPPNPTSTTTQDLNQPIDRATYAAWLLAVHNRVFADQPSKKIRPAVSGGQAAFQDVPPTHPAYAAVQGLAEAGIIPSALTGNSTAVNFRPDAPLTREDLLLWKVPLDTRKALPAATVDTVKEVWGFQDAADIDPLSLQAILADHQLGEFANILRAFGYTRLFQPNKAVTQAEAIASLWRFGSITEGISASQLLKKPSPNGPESQPPGSNPRETGTP